MSFSVSKNKVTKVLYIGLSLLFLILLLGYELFWRYSSHLDIVIRTAIHDSRSNERTVLIKEQSDSPVDTNRREYKDIHHGRTLVAIWLAGSADTLHLTLEGKYFSEARSVHMAADSSSQLILIPNTIQGMPSGWSTTLYLKNDSTLTLLEFGYFIGDPNHDGKEEVNVPERGGWMKLNTSTGEWVAAPL